MSSRWSDAALRRLALVLLLLFTVLTVLAIALAPETIGRPARSRPQETPLDLGFAISGFALVTVGVLLAWLRPRNRFGWLFAFCGVLGSLCNAGQVYGSLALSAPEKHLPAGHLALALSAPLWVPPLVIPASIVLVRFPSGTITGRWARIFDRAVIIGLLVLYFGYAASSHAITDEIRDPSPPHLIPNTVAEVLTIGGLFIVVIGLFGTIATTIARMLRAGNPERQQILLLLIATVIAIVAVIFSPYAWVGSVGFACIPAAVAVGVLRYRLFGIDVVVRRTLVYATLTGLVLAVFVTVTAGLAAVVPHGPAPVVVAASLIAVGLAPARDRVQRFVDRVVYGARSDPFSALTRLSSPLGGPAGEDVLGQTAEALGDALRVPCVEVRDRGGELLARWGDGPAMHELPMQFGGEPLGTLAVGLRAGDEVLPKAERSLLDAVTPLVAVIVHALRLTADLRAAQERLRDAVATERSRLRQDLHDGLGPSLTGIGLGLEALESAAPPRSGELVARLRSEAGSALDEVRRIIDDLRPGALDEQGLLEALHGRVTHLGHASGLHLELRAPASLDVPPEVEVAAYRIVEEALTNVVKHANASRCSIDIHVDQALHVVVGDDGIGLRRRDGDAASGVGLQSMRARAERLGGRFAARDCGPGTEICIELPLEVP